MFFISDGIKSLSSVAVIGTLRWVIALTTSSRILGGFWSLSLSAEGGGGEGSAGWKRRCGRSNPRIERSKGPC